MAQPVTVEVSDLVFEKARKLAEQSGRSIEAILIEWLEWGAAEKSYTFYTPYGNEDAAIALMQMLEAQADAKPINPNAAKWDLIGLNELTNHKPYLREAIALSESAMAKGNEPFGALLVRGGVVLLRIENSVATGHDMTNHAEMNLVKEAMQQYEPTELHDCTLYTSTEPCAMCAGATYWSGIGRVIFGCSEARLGEIAGIGLAVPCRHIFESGARQVEVVGPLLEEEAAAVHLRYWPTVLGD